MNSISPLRVVVAGGGIAGLEALLALHDLGEGELELTLIAPNPDFVLRPLIVAEPFAVGHRDRVPLTEVAGHLGANLVRDELVGVDPGERLALCASGDEVPYDVLVLATGAHQFAPYASGALTFGLTSDPMAFNGLLSDIEAGHCPSVAFVVPPGTSWALPLYEVALMTAHQAWSMSRDDTSYTLITPEASPLAVFGDEASAAVAELLDHAGIAVEAGVHAEVLPGGQVRLTPGSRRLAFNRIVTLPLVAGPRLTGVPVDARGFVPVDEFGRVSGLDGVYCAGDASDFAIKQGGLATQQADAVAAHIAAGAGADLEPQPFRPVLRGRLLTGDKDRFLRHEVAGAAGGEASENELWWPPAKVSGLYLSPWLDSRGVGRPRGKPPTRGIDISLPFSPLGMPAPGLELEPLGHMGPIPTAGRRLG
jgi:sulfide:quinone oxidoreductase